MCATTRSCSAPSAWTCSPCCWGGATALLPVFARDVIPHAGTQGFGFLRASPAVGAGVVAFSLGRWPLQKRAGLWMFGGVTVFALATLIFAVSKNLWLSCLALPSSAAAT